MVKIHKRSLNSVAINSVCIIHIDSRPSVSTRVCVMYTRYLSLLHQPNSRVLCSLCLESGNHGSKLVLRHSAAQVGYRR